MAPGGEIPRDVARGARSRGGEIPVTPVSTSTNLVAGTGTIACSSNQKKQSDWFLLILVAKKLIQLPELIARSPVNARFHLRFRAARALIAQSLGRAAEFAEVHGNWP